MDVGDEVGMITGRRGVFTTLFLAQSRPRSDARPPRLFEFERVVEVIVVLGFDGCKDVFRIDEVLVRNSEDAETYN